MIFYIDGEEVSEKKAKAYFFKGHKLTTEKLAKKGAPATMESAESIWNCRWYPPTQEHIFNISAIQEDGGLEFENENE